MTGARALPVLSGDPPPRRRLPLAPDSRPEDRAARPEYVVWELTLACDLRCIHCGSRAGKRRPDELSTAEALALVDRLAEMGAREVTLIGGEAYLHAGWLDVIGALAKKGILTGVLTGGRGMTRDRARAAKDAGAEVISVSLDGTEAVHDHVRAREGSYRAALVAMENVRAAGLRLTANTQISRPALRTIEPMFDVLLDAEIRAWQVSLTVPMGRAADRPELLLEPYDVLAVMPMLARITARAKARGVDVFPGDDIGYFGPYEGVLRPEGPRKACSAGRLGMGIEADGAIKGCPSLPSEAYVGGNVRDTPLRDIWERSEKLRFTRDRTVDGLGATADLVITPRHAWEAARGLRTCSSARSAITRTAIIARSSSCARGAASASSRWRARPADHSIVGSSRSSRRPIRSLPSPRPAPSSKRRAASSATVEPRRRRLPVGLARPVATERAALLGDASSVLRPCDRGEDTLASAAIDPVRGRGCPHARCAPWSGPARR